MQRVEEVEEVKQAEEARFFSTRSRRTNCRLG